MGSLLSAEYSSVKGSQPADTSPFPSADGPNWPATRARARENWFPATPIVEDLGRRPTRDKYKRWRSQQQRAFAAGIIHSIGIYEGLRPHVQEIRAMLVARNLIDARRAIPSSEGSGARPPADVVTDDAAATWLQNNYITATRSRRAKTRNADEEPYKLYLVDDSVAAHLDSTGKRELFALNQLVAWVLLWANRGLEVRWLGMEVGFGIFTTCACRADSIRIFGIADYDVRDPHAPMQFGANKTDRKRRNFETDKVTAYGPFALLNASCETHAIVTFGDEDSGDNSRRVFTKQKDQNNKMVAAGQQVLLSYSPPNDHHSQCWLCPGLGPDRQCRQKCGPPVTRLIPIG